MLDFRLKAYELYRKLPMPDFGPDLSPLDFEHINYFRRDSDRVARDWDDTRFSWSGLRVSLPSLPCTGAVCVKLLVLH